VDILPINVEMDGKRLTFLRQVFGTEEGYVCIAYGTKDRKHFREEFFKWPHDVDEILGLVNRVYQGHNVWFCPQLLDKRARKKENVSFTPCAWSDLDTCEPENLLIDPTITMESSPGRYQAYWIFDREVDPVDAENLSQRIAYKHADDGADRSGWDLTQLLRFPYTYNYKYASTPIVAPFEVTRNKYRLTDFEDIYPQVAGFEYMDVPLPEGGTIPNADEILQQNRLKVNPMIWRLYQEELPKGDSWSETLWKLEMLLFEAGFDRLQVFAIARESKCNKYAKKGQSERHLWREVVRAESKHLQNVNAFAPKDYIEKPLVTDEERRQVESEDTIIERYIEWAKSLGDAAPQYHQAGAFIALSSLLAGNVQLPTSFGTLKPNLWFMILADTTLTRKSTAMDIAMDLVMEIDPDAMMATDGSIEGLLTALSTRPGRPSVFLRDEFSGLLEMITKKDYYAGMPELLTKLYDGKMQKRILRKESIDVRDPCLILFAGGIKNKITSLLSFEHVSSGFMPRFIFITAESDITRVKPLGPPTSWTDNNREAIFNELTDLAEHYKQTTTMVIQKLNIEMETQKKWNAQLTPEAWYRYNELETQMLDAGIHSERPEIVTPVYDRLSKSILKAAVLLAAARQKEEIISVEEKDIVRAAAYGENWRMFVREVMGSVGKGQAERQLDNIYNAICRRPGVSRSVLMQSYHLSARDANQLFETLEQRSLISRTKQGRGEVFFPTVINQPIEVNFEGVNS
jgi:hypothetical protein